MLWGRHVEVREIIESLTYFYDYQLTFVILLITNNNLL
jgi:hypothetical protein